MRKREKIFLILKLIIPINTKVFKNKKIKKYMLCLYIYKFIHGVPENIQNLFSKINLQDTRISKFTELKFTIKEENESYIYARMYYKIPFEDIDYRVQDDLSDNFNSITNSKSSYIDFYIFKQNNYIIMDNKTIGKYVVKVLDKFISLDSEEESVFQEINIDLNKIFDDYKTGIYQDLWLNGVKGEGHIKSFQQIGSNIDQDNEFKFSNNKYGVGIQMREMFPGMKIAIYDQGVINILSKIPDSENYIIFRNRIVNYFEKYF